MLRAAYHIEPLDKSHARESFRCGHAALDRYLQQQARQDVLNQVAAVFVAVEPSSRQVVGYHTLSASTVNVAEVPPDIAKRLPRYPQLPVTLLGRLAVDERFRGKGLGQFLLMDALHRSQQAAAGIAAMAVVVDAKDETASAFYQRYGFAPLNARAGRLFLPMKTIATLFQA